MRAGRLRRLMTLQTSTKAVAVGGKRTITWSDVAELWIGIKPLSGNELQSARATDAKVTHELTARYRSGVRPEHRLKFGQRIFNIKSVLDVDERNRTMKLICAEDL